MKITELEKHPSQMTKEELEQECFKLLKEMNQIQDLADRRHENARTNRDRN